MEENKPEYIMHDLAAKAANDVMGFLMNQFQDEGKDKCYRRSMFKQNPRDEYAYNCNITLDVELIDGSKSAHIIMRFGK